MAHLKYYIVDVFAEAKYTGNQLAVFTNAAELSTLEMQAIAKEINYSETTFITESEKKLGGYDVRIFTPKKELPFAGHPTIGTAYILQQKIIKQPIENILLNLQVGQISVTFNYSNGEVEWLWMQQKAPTFHQILPSYKLAEILEIDVKEIDSRFPIQEVSTGVPFVITPLKSLQSLKKIKLNKEKYLQLIDTIEAKCILTFCPETYHQDNQLCVRVFADYLGIPEDPATGSANGCLAGYLVKYSYFRESDIGKSEIGKSDIGESDIGKSDIGESEINIKVEQGYEIDRPSLILLQAKEKNTEIEVNVGGKVIEIAKGEWGVGNGE